MKEVYLPYVRFSNTILDSGFHAVDSIFQVMDIIDSFFFVSVTWTADSYH